MSFAAHAMHHSPPVLIRLTRAARRAVAVSGLLCPVVSLAQSQIERVGDGSAGTVSDVVAASLRPNRVVTAVRNAAGNLQLIHWRAESDGSAVTQLGSLEAGSVGGMAIAAAGDERVVTAVQNSAGNLELITWDARLDGTLVRRGGAVAGRASNLSVATIGAGRVVTALTDDARKLRLISWALSDAGAWTRLDEATDVEVDHTAIVAYEDDRLVTVSRRFTGTLDVVTWSIAADGRLTRLANATSEALVAPRATLVGWRQLGIVGRTSAGALRVQTWDIDAADLPVRHQVASAGQATDATIGALGAAHLITAVRTSTGALRLIRWDAIDTLVRLGETDAGAASRLALVMLPDHRFVTAMRQGNGTLKLIAWHDQLVTLVRARTGPAMTAVGAGSDRSSRLARAEALLPRVERQPSLADDRAPVPRARAGVRLQPSTLDVEWGPALPDVSALWRTFEPTTQSAWWDPMVAAGPDRLTISNSHAFGFYDLDGAPLPSKAGEATTMSSAQFFRPLVAPTTPTGAPNRHSLNRHLGFRPGWTTGLRCDPTRPAPQPEPCVDEFYDSRAIYDPVSRRVVLLSAVRHSYGLSDDSARATDPMVRRYLAFAVSRTEDPRDGFWMYATTEQNYSDWPRVTVAEGMLVIAHNRHTHPRDYEGTRPAVYLFRLTDLAQGRPYPASRKLLRHEVGGNVKPVVPYGASPGWAMLLRQDDAKLALLSLRGITDWTQAPVLKRDSITAASALPFMGVAPIVRDGRLYFAGHAEVAAATGTQRPRYGMRLLRLPLTGLASHPRMDETTAGGALDRCLVCDGTGNRTAEVPSIGVTADGSMVIGFGLSSVTLTDSLPPEARYVVLGASAATAEPSVLIRAGEHMPFDVPKNTTRRQITTPSVRMDHSHVTVSPDGRTVWVIGMYALRAEGTDTTSVNGYRTVVRRFRR
jgi:hypothetical protein